MPALTVSPTLTNSSTLPSFGISTACCGNDTDALRAAGGLTANAYLYATVFTRESVRITQQVNYDRALRDFETQIASAAATRGLGGHRGGGSCVIKAPSTPQAEPMTSCQAV